MLSLRCWLKMLGGLPVKPAFRVRRTAHQEEWSEDGVEKMKVKRSDEVKGKKKK